MHPNQLWLCKVCSRGYKSCNGCYKHEKSREDIKLCCAVCGKGFNYKKDLKLHLPVHSEELKVFCPDCGKGFASDRSLTNHAALHQNLQFSCSERSYVNNTKEKLQYHWRGQHRPGFTTLCGDLHTSGQEDNKNMRRSVNSVESKRNSSKRNNFLASEMNNLCFPNFKALLIVLCQF